MWGKSNAKFKIWRSIFNAFLISITLNIIITYLFPEFIDRLSNVVEKKDFLVNKNVYRPDNFNAYNEPLKILQTQYLALFPTLGEILSTPYKLIILVDSIILISVFINSWVKII